MEKVNYRKISNWALATDFYHTWREIFNYIKENHRLFYIWHPYFSSSLQLKCVDLNKYMTPIFETVGFIGKNFDEHIRNIKFKRGKKKQKSYVYKNTPKILVKHIFKSYLYYEFAIPTISHTDEIRIPHYEYNASIDVFVNIFESLFNKINLQDKKKLFKGINRWKIKKDKWSVISFWNCINDIFKIEFMLSYSLDEKLRDTKSNTLYNGSICIDTVEHYHMKDKCEKWLVAKRKEIEDKKKLEKSNI